MNLSQSQTSSSRGTMRSTLTSIPPARRQLHHAAMSSYAGVALTTTAVLASSMPFIQRIDSFAVWPIPGRRPRKKALLIGIQYQPRPGHLNPTWQQLHLPHADVLELRDVLKDLGYRVTVMLDDPAYPDHLQPNCFNILREMLNLVHDARPGDKLFFGYGGHGKQIPTLDPGEEDKLAEYIVPGDGYIIDNTLHAILVKSLPPGVKLFALFDSCNSGTILDLRYSWNVEGKRIRGPHSFPPRSPVERCFDRVGFGASWLTPKSEIVCFSAAKDGCTVLEFAATGSKCSYMHTFTAMLRTYPRVTVGAAFRGIEQSLQSALAEWVAHGPEGERNAFLDPQLSSNNPYFDQNQPLRNFF